MFNLYVMLVTSISIHTGNLNFIILRKDVNTYFYIYTKSLYFFLKIKEPIFYNVNSKTLSFTFFDDLKKNKGVSSYVNFFLKNWSNLFFQKIKFKGKGYKIRKRKNAVRFFFGRSHLTSVWFKGMKVKRLHKYKLFVASSSSHRMYLMEKFVRAIRQLNIYTRRGLRLSRQKVVKKAGKKSAYV